MNYKVEIVIRRKAPTRGKAAGKVNQLLGKLSKVNLRPDSVTIVPEEDEREPQDE